jgi:hypothetical protein
MYLCRLIYDSPGSYTAIRHHSDVSVQSLPPGKGARLPIVSPSFDQEHLFAALVTDMHPLARVVGSQMANFSNFFRSGRPMSNLQVIHEHLTLFHDAKGLGKKGQAGGNPLSGLVNLIGNALKMPKGSEDARLVCIERERERERETERERESKPGYLCATPPKTSHPIESVYQLFLTAGLGFRV